MLPWECLKPALTTTERSFHSPNTLLAPWLHLYRMHSFVGECLNMHGLSVYHSFRFKSYLNHKFQVFVLFYTSDAGFTSYATLEMVDVVGTGPAGGGAHFGTSVSAMGDLDGNGVSLIFQEGVLVFVEPFLLYKILHWLWSMLHTYMICLHREHFSFLYI